MTQDSANISFTEHWERKALRFDHYEGRGIALPSRPAQHGSAGETERPPEPAGSTSIRSKIVQRLRGPGGYYNLGNAIGLASGLAFQIAASRGSASGEMTVAGTIGSYLFGSPSATALTVATLIFFVSGELYHRAWQSSGAGPDRERLVQADLLSGVGAVCLAVALLLLGSVWLAMASTALLAGGKFGNALAPDRGLRFTIFNRTFDAFRLAPALSRVPAMTALSVELSLSLLTASGGPTLPLQALILLTCYCLWLRADLLLLRS